MADKKHLNRVEKDEHMILNHMRLAAVAAAIFVGAVRGDVGCLLLVVTQQVRDVACGEVVGQTGAVGAPGVRRLPGVLGGVVGLLVGAERCRAL